MRRIGVRRIAVAGGDHRARLGHLDAMLPRLTHLTECADDDAE